MEIAKNGKVEYPVEVRARIYPVTPDGAQWEVKLHVEADFGMGKEIVGEITMRSYNGGLSPLRQMNSQCFKVAKQIIEEAAMMLQQMAKQQAAANSGIVVARDMPGEPRQ